MKISEITAAHVIDYLKLEPDDLNVSEISQIETLISTAKAFIKSYTGLCDETVNDEDLGEGDGVETKYHTRYSPLVGGTVIIYANGAELVENTDYAIDYSTGGILFSSAPAVGVAITANYTAGIDAFGDLVMAVYVLVQDMFDNRSYYVDKTNLNKVIECILGMHRRNFV